MNYEKIGSLIRSLRIEHKLTQKQLAEFMNISDKTISKWERGLGCPDISLLPRLSEIFGVNLENLLSGDLDANSLVGGNMKKLKFYVCKTCGNLITATGEATISCCGKRMQEEVPQKAKEEEKLKVELIENEHFISSDHEMTKDHYIAFVALLTGDSMILRKMYPEWNFQTRIPRLSRGTLLWYSTRDGLYYQYL